MSLDKATVAKIASLAHLRVPEADLDQLASELNQIIGWVEQLNQVDTENVPPMTSVVAVDLPRRADQVTDGNVRDNVLANAPDARDGFFAVPKVME